jgi:hypothetical protein
VKTYSLLTFVIIASGTGCSPLSGSGAEHEYPMKVQAMFRTLDEMSALKLQEHEASHVSYFVTIAPTPPNPDGVTTLLYNNKPYQVDYDLGTIESAQAATIVQKHWGAGKRLIGVHTEIRYWDRGDWVTSDQYLRARYPHEMAQLDELRSATRPATTVPAAEAPGN